MHGGIVSQTLEKKAAVATYRLTKYQARMQEFANSSEIKSLREEIGIIRMVLEELINSCDSTNKLIVFTDRISHLVEQLRKLVESCQRLEVQNNDLLDRKIVIVIADTIVTRIGNYVHDPEKLKLLAGEIVADITNLASGTDISGTEPQVDYAA